jgi:hypothetical protein
MLDTAVYVGAGADIRPILLFTHIKTFIYIDSQPLTEFGGYELFPGCERPDFPVKITQILEKYNFTKSDTQDQNLHLYFNKKTEQLVKYYMNCCFPHNLSQNLLKNIQMANVLICCGYCPHVNILSLMNPCPKTFIGDNKTCYDIPEGDENYITVDRILNANPSLMKEYIRFDYPQDYKYWEYEYIEEAYIGQFVITSHKTLADLYTAKCKS